MSEKNCNNCPITSEIEKSGANLREKPLIQKWEIVMTADDGRKIVLDGDSIPDSVSKEIDDAIENTEGYPVEWHDTCGECGEEKKFFMHNCDGNSDYPEIYGCPKCDDHCGFCEGE